MKLVVPLTMPRIFSKRLAAASAGFEVQGHVVLARQSEQLGAFLGDELFVGGDYVLAGRERGFDEGLRGLGAADDFDHDADVRVAQHGAGIGREHGVRQPRGGALGRVDIRGLEQFDGHAGFTQEVLFLQGEKLHDAAADGAATDHSDPEVCAGHGSSPGKSPWRAPASTPEWAKTYRPFASSSTAEVGGLGNWRGGLASDCARNCAVLRT
jgi:hypothetical protein